MTKPLFSVVIPVFNRWDMTESCLKSLAAHTCNIQYEVIVVDNGSSDATVTALAPLGAQLFGESFTRLRFENNRNYAAGCNAGAKIAKANLLFLLNNDTHLTPNWVLPLLAMLSDTPNLGIVAPLLLYPNDRVQHIGVTMYPIGVDHLYKNFPVDHPLVSRPRELQAITAAAIMLPKSLFMECGMFCEEYKNGFEDMELCSHIRNKGKRLGIAPASRIYHFESQSPGRKNNETDNAQLFHARCGNVFTPDYHHFAIADGYIPSLSPTLNVWLNLPQERIAALPDPVAAPEKAFEALLQEPMWQEGYPPVLAYLETTGQKEQAFFLSSLECEFYPGRASYLRYAKLTTRLKNLESHQEAARALRIAEEKLRDTRMLQRRVMHIQKTIADTNDELLASMLQKWQQSRS